MNIELLEKHFARMGARVKTVRHELVTNPWRRVRPSFLGDFSVDIQRDRKGEHFVFNVLNEAVDQLDLEILQVQPAERHLLLLVKGFGENAHAPSKDRFLCGHDEREWFVAAVPGAVSTVSSAMESLKPQKVLRSQSRKGLSQKQRNKRKNKAFRRQGEWFFLPVENAVVDESLVLFNEPIARSGGKPHRVQYLYRHGGQVIYTCQKFPSGLLEKEYRDLILRNPKAKSWSWKVQRINPRVLARGEVRHPDHKTITLEVWHEVLMNRETESRTMSHVAFID